MNLKEDKQRENSHEYFKPDYIIKYISELQIEMVSRGSDDESAYDENDDTYDQLIKDIEEFVNSKYGVDYVTINHVGSETKLK